MTASEAQPVLQQQKAGTDLWRSWAVGQLRRVGTIRKGWLSEPMVNELTFADLPGQVNKAGMDGYLCCANGAHTCSHITHTLHLPLRLQCITRLPAGAEVESLQAPLQQRVAPLPSPPAAVRTLIPACLGSSLAQGPGRGDATHKSESLTLIVGMCVVGGGCCVPATCVQGDAA